MRVAAGRAEGAPRPVTPATTNPTRCRPPTHPSPPRRRMIGRDFEKGLDALAAVAEGDAAG
jgi:hypothetical protein